MGNRKPLEANGSYIFVYMRDSECTVSQMGSHIQQNITLCPFKWAAECI